MRLQLLGMQHAWWRFLRCAHAAAVGAPAGHTTGHSAAMCAHQSALWRCACSSCRRNSRTSWGILQFSVAIGVFVRRACSCYRPGPSRTLWGMAQLGAPIGAACRCCARVLTAAAGASAWLLWARSTQGAPMVLLGVQQLCVRACCGCRRNSRMSGREQPGVRLW